MEKSGEGRGGAPTEQEEKLMVLLDKVVKKMEATNHISKTIKKKGKDDKFNRDKNNNDNRFNQPGNSFSAKRRKAAKEARKKMKKDSTIAWRPTSKSGRR